MEQTFNQLDDYTLFKCWAKVLQNHSQPENVLKAAGLNEDQKNKILRIINALKTKPDLSVKDLVIAEQEKWRNKIIKWNNRFVDFLNSDSYKHSHLESERAFNNSLDELTKKLAHHISQIDQHNILVEADIKKTILSIREKFGYVVNNILNIAAREIIDLNKGLKPFKLSRDILFNKCEQKTNDWKLNEFIAAIKVANECLNISKFDPSNKPIFVPRLRVFKNKLSKELNDIEKEWKTFGKELVELTKRIRIRFIHEGTKDSIRFTSKNIISGLEEYSKNFELFVNKASYLEKKLLPESLKKLKSCINTNDITEIEKMLYQQFSIIINCLWENGLFNSHIIDQFKDEMSTWPISDKWSKFIAYSGEELVWELYQIIQLLNIINKSFEKYDKSKQQDSKVGFIFYKYTHEDTTKDPVDQCAEFLGLPMWIEPKERDKANFEKHMRFLMARYHPDRNKDNPQAENITKGIQQAKNQLLLK